MTLCVKGESTLKSIMTENISSVSFENDAKSREIFF